MEEQRLTLTFQPLLIITLLSFHLSTSRRLTVNHIACIRTNMAAYSVTSTTEVHFTQLRFLIQFMVAPLQSVHFTRCYTALSEEWSSKRNVRMSCMTSYIWASVDVGCPSSTLTVTSVCVSDAHSSECKTVRCRMQRWHRGRVLIRLRCR